MYIEWGKLFSQDIESVKKWIAVARDEELNEALLWASKSPHANTEVVKLLLADERTDVNAKDLEMTPLLWASHYANAEVVKLLLADTRTDVNGKSGLVGSTALLWASRFGNAEVVKLLLADERTDVNAKDHLRETPLLLASRLGSAEVVEALLQCNAIDIEAKNNWGETAIQVIENPKIFGLMCDHFLAKKNDDKRFSRLLWRQGFYRNQLSLNDPLRIDNDFVKKVIDHNNLRLLHFCFLDPDHWLAKEVIKVFNGDNLQSQFDPDADVKLQKFLTLKQALSSEVKVDGTRTFSDHQIRVIISDLISHPKKLEEIVRYVEVLGELQVSESELSKVKQPPDEFKRENPDPDVVAGGDSLLHLTYNILSETDNLRFFQVMLDCGFVTNVAHLRKLLMDVVKYNDEREFDHVIDRVKNINFLDNNTDKTPLMSAVEKEHFVIAQKLMAHPEINVNVQNKAGETALICAAKAGANSTLELLMDDDRVDRNIADQKKLTALDYAKTCGHQEAVKILEKPSKTMQPLDNNVFQFAQVVGQNRSLP